MHFMWLYFCKLSLVIMHIWSLKRFVQCNKFVHTIYIDCSYVKKLVHFVNSDTKPLKFVNVY